MEYFILFTADCNTKMSANLWPLIRTTPSGLQHTTYIRIYSWITPWYFALSWAERTHMVTGSDDWYLPIEGLRQPLALQKAAPLPNDRLASIGVGVEVDRCVIDGGLWDIRMGGGGCHSSWRRGVRWGGRCRRGREGVASGAGPGNRVGGRGVRGGKARLQQKRRLRWLRGASGLESGGLWGNGGGSRGGSCDHAAVPPERPGGLVVRSTGLTWRLGVCSARGRVSDWDGLNDFLRFVLDQCGETHSMQIQQIHNKHMQVNHSFKSTAHTQKCIKIQRCFHTYVWMKVMPVLHEFKRCDNTWPVRAVTHAKPMSFLTISAGHNKHAPY